MKRIRFSEEQIDAALREHEAGAKTADLARKHGGLGRDAVQLEGQVWRARSIGGQRRFRL